MLDTSEIYLERWRQLIRVLEGVPEQKLNMGTWCDDEAECGTVACAAGWAGMDPWFVERGFRTSLKGNGVALYVGNSAWRMDYDACRDFFGADDDEAEHIFDPKTYKDRFGFSACDITPPMVIARIRELLAKQGVTL